MVRLLAVLLKVVIFEAIQTLTSSLTLRIFEHVAEPFAPVILDFGAFVSSMTRLLAAAAVALEWLLLHGL